MFSKLALNIALACSLITSPLLLVFNGCSQKSKMDRPANISPDAVFVGGGKVGGWWQQCASLNGGNRCRIWNAGGLLLVDEEFLPYDSGASPTRDELKIAPDPLFPGPDRIFLSNGRVLLPRSRFEELKRFVDWLNGKVAQPH